MAFFLQSASLYLFPQQQKNGGMIVEPFGKLSYNKRLKEWFGMASNIDSTNTIELSIASAFEELNIEAEIESVRKLAAEYDLIVSLLYDLIYRSFQDSDLEKSLTEIQNMYHLVAIALQADAKTWWITMEPNFAVTSMYNHFKRFTMVNREIIWMNFTI